MKELKFIHITKCAGTFIEELGRSYDIKWGKHHKEYGFWHDIFINKSPELKQKYDWFTIVRNPYTRILSEYYCQWGGINHESQKNIIIKDKKDFNNYLIKKIHNRCETGHHYTEQYKYMDKKSVISIIKLEYMDIYLPELFNKYDLDIDIKMFKKLNTKESKMDILDYTVDDFNDELINLINTVYETDFELFNYDMIKTN